MRRVSETVQVHAYQAGAVDRYGNPVAGYAAPVDVGVYLVSPRQSIEQDKVGRRPIITGLTVYAPLGTSISPQDRVGVSGVLYDVEGVPAVWDGNPHGRSFSHGCVQFDLERSEG